MRKIPTMFVRDFDHDHGRYVTRDVAPGCEWVLAGEGHATRKFDGTCVRVDDQGAIWSRREVKAGGVQPPGFIPVQLDSGTGKVVGWEPYQQSSFATFVDEALRIDGVVPAGGTYELIGPKVNGNPENADHHMLVPHGQFKTVVDRDFDSLMTFFVEHPGWEGLVFWRTDSVDGDLAKIKARDFRTG